MIKPRTHQQELIDFHEQSKMLGTLGWHGMGLGKTLSTLWLARNHLGRLRSMGVKDPRFMVILPKSAIPTWKVECNKHTPDLNRSMVIYPYSQLHHATKQLKYIDVRMIVFDESHYLKSPETNRIEVLSNFLKEVEAQPGRFDKGRILMLTGTPMPNSAAELYTSWALCTAPTLSEAAKRVKDMKRYDDWKITFAQKKEQKWEEFSPKMKKKIIKTGTKFEGVAHEDMLQQLLSPFVHYKRVEDCIDLPDKQEIPIDLGLPDDKLLKDANIETPEAYMALLERLARAKTPHMIEWVKTFLEGSTEQLLVFAMYRFPIEELAEKFPNHVRLITGTETNAERAENLKDFQEGKYRILGLTFKAGAESLNAQNACYTLYHGYPWNYATLSQGMARTYRSGQARKTFHYFLTSGYNDMRILDIVLHKKEATEKIEDLLLTAPRTLEELV